MRNYKVFIEPESGDYYLCQFNTPVLGSIELSDDFIALMDKVTEIRRLKAGILKRLYAGDSLESLSNKVQQLKDLLK